MDNVYQEVFEILEELLPKKREKVIFYAEYSSFLSAWVFYFRYFFLHPVSHVSRALSCFL